jgi:hypothetical protein
LKATHLALVFFLLVAAFCLAQNAAPALNSDDSSSDASNSDASHSEQSSASAGQTQGQTPPPAKPPAGQTTDQGQNQTQGKDTKDSPNDTSGTSKDRLFFALPNFLTLENAGQVPPLTTGEKYKVVAKGSFDPIELAWYAALSGVSQAENSEQGFGQGWAAYGKRYGAYAADGTIENFFVGAIFPSMLHQDPRYFQSGQGGFWQRSEYSVSRIFITRTDSWHSQFNYSEIVGSAMASAISTYSYHPHPGYHPVPGENVPYIASDRTFKNTASVWGSQVGYDTITLVVKEFWPDIRRKIRKQPH